MDNNLIKAADYWSNKQSDIIKSRWWHHEIITSHVNRILTGNPEQGFHHVLKLLANQRSSGKFQRAISIGCGMGNKEMSLLKLGIVGHFDLVEISDSRIAAGKQLAIEKNLEDRVNFIKKDIFSSEHKATYDLVYWNNSLHHMLNAKTAVSWSSDHLLNDGIFAMDDFVGPSRFQWSEYNIEMASRIRALMPEELLINYKNPHKLLPKTINRPSVASMIEIDPSEAADSSRILPSIKMIFPHAEVKLTGGCIYHLALNDALANFSNTSEHNNLLKILLSLDEAMAVSGESHYAVAIARKH